MSDCRDGKEGTCQALASLPRYPQLHVLSGELAGKWSNVERSEDQPSERLTFCLCRLAPSTLNIYRSILADEFVIVFIEDFLLRNVMFIAVTYQQLAPTMRARTCVRAVCVIRTTAYLDQCLNCLNLLRLSISSSVLKDAGCNLIDRFRFIRTGSSVRLINCYITEQNSGSEFSKKVEFDLQISKINGNLLRLKVFIRISIYGKIHRICTGFISIPDS